MTQSEIEPKWVTGNMKDWITQIHGARALFDSCLSSQTERYIQKINIYFSGVPEQSVLCHTNMIFLQAE